jgi:hypothetical protein
MLNVNKRLILDSVEYDGYTIESMEINFLNDVVSIKVSYFNRTKHLKTVRNYKVNVGDEINLQDAVDQIHEIHNNILIV